jgi:hypothetical protein
MSLHATSTPRADGSAARDRGIALVMTMLLTGLLTALGLALTMLTTVETWLSAGLRTSQELSYAADAIVARTRIDLTRSSDWTSILRSGASTFNDGRSSIALADGTIIDLARETRALQSDSDGRCGSRAANPDCPEWHLFAHAPAADLVPGRVVETPLYVVAWVADDGFDGDGDPDADVNGRLLVRGRAFGLGGARRSIEVVCGRVAPAAIQMLSWRELR